MLSSPAQVSTLSQRSFNSLAAGHTGTYQHATKGANVVTTIKLSFLEAALGAQREFTASVRLHCPDCSGSGLSSSVKPEDCASCKGVGQILRFEHCESGEQTKTRSLDPNHAGLTRRGLFGGALQF